MSTVHQTVEIVGSSTQGVDDAMRQAVAQALDTLAHRTRVGLENPHDPLRVLVICLAIEREQPANRVDGTGRPLGRQHARPEFASIATVTGLVGKAHA
jgi:hypothetical protein